MKHKFNLALSILAACTGLMTLTGSPTVGQLQQDWLKMEALLDQKDTFLYQHEFDREPVAFAERWLSFRDEMQEVLKDWAERYGRDQYPLLDQFAEVEKPEGSKRESYEIVNLYLGTDLTQEHARIVQWATFRGEDQWRRWEQLAQPSETQMELKLRYANQAWEGYKALALLEPDKDHSASIQKAKQAAETSRTAYMQVLKAIQWPGHNSSFEGPGRPDELAKAALSFLQANPNWSKPEYDDEHTPYAAAVAGSSWEVWKRAPLTQEPTQYSLDIVVAFTGTKDPDIVYVYQMVFYTAEEAGVSKGLPFRFANSKQYRKHQMLKSAIPGDAVKVSVADRRAAERAAAGKRPGGFGAWRLLFSLMLMVGGAYLAKSTIAAQLPAADSALSRLEPASMYLGLILLVMGLLGFLGNFFTLALFRSLLPQVAAILAGIVILLQSQDQTIGRYLQRLKGLESNATTLGLASIALGLLHLLLGGLPLI